MGRPAARVRYDEITRLLKAVKAAGVDIGAVRFNGEAVEIVPKSGDSGENAPAPLEKHSPSDGPIREPQL